MRLNALSVVSKLTIALLLLASALGGAAFAGEIYKWTDADGNVQYGDRPSASDDAERLQIASRPTDPNRIQAQTVALQEQLAAARDAKSKEPEGPTPEELRAEANERASKCSMYRERLERFIQSRLLYREDAKGERVYLDEAETLAAREKVQQQVEEFCN